jgi:ankyrin repeat protein
MKKTIIITAIALGFSMTNLNAMNQITSAKSIEFVKVKPTVSPFCMSIVKGDIETVKKLIELGADVNKKSNGMTPAMYAAKFNKVEILKLLVEHGANVDLKSDNGLKAEKYAEQSNAKEVLAYLEELES